MPTLKQKFLSSVAVISLFGAQAALAADLPSALPVKAPILSRPLWTGFYVGGHAGYSWGSVDGDTTNNFVPPTPPFSLVPGTVVFSFERDVNPRGALGGFQAGYNFQAGQVVYGIEADVSWTGQRDSFDFTGHAVIFGGEDFNYQETLEAKLRYMGTVRGRIGHAFGNFLPYLTGGLAWGRMTMALNWLASQNSAPQLPPFATASFAGTEGHTLVGWTIGAGLEYAFAKQWSAKAEYLYVDLGEKTFFPGIQGGGSFGLQDHIVRIGINFRT